MTATSPARRLLLHAVPALLAVAVAGGVTPACYSAGAGTSPPGKGFYYPVGLVVSGDGKYLYAANSDFDLQWNGGTLQSYDLGRIRTDSARLVRANVGGTPLDPGSAIPFLGSGGAGCTVSGPSIPLEETCAPPVDSSRYVIDDAIIGAFATDLQIGLGGQRLFTPVRGDATLTWADLRGDGTFDCGKGPDGRCGLDHQAGTVRDPGNSRQVTMPGEPFGMAQTQDGTALAITHQTDTKTTLFQTLGTDLHRSPSVEFVLDGMPLGGDGIVAVPHDDVAVTRCEKVHDQPPCVRPAFLQTSRSVAEVDLLRYYDDDSTRAPSTLSRPFLSREVAYNLSTNSGGFDSRGIAVDTTPRAACRARLPAGTDLATDPQSVACGQVPARVFIANRSPPSLVVGELGGPSGSGDGTYDPDRLVLTGNVPLAEGPSRVYVAPIVDRTGPGVLSARVFIVCFDSSTVFVYDPDAQAVENVIYVGPGPFAMAFDPFSSDAMATHAADPVDPLGLRPYRFAYVASFRDSFVQVIDLDATSPRTFERVVFTLGQPTPPKGS